MCILNCRSPENLNSTIAARTESNPNRTMDFMTNMELRDGHKERGASLLRLFSWFWVGFDWWRPRIGWTKQPRDELKRECKLYITIWFQLLDQGVNKSCCQIIEADIPGTSPACQCSANAPVWSLELTELLSCASSPQTMHLIFWCRARQWK